MNAGKSSTLLQAAHNYHERGMRTLLYAPSIDDRHGVGQITSRIGLHSDAIVLPATTNLFGDVRQRHLEKPVHCVLIDEAQFLSAQQVLQATMVCDQLGIPVLCYGIRTDFQGEPFEGSKYLLAWAEEITELKTVCHSGRKATMNARMDAEGNRVWTGKQVEIGHHYVAMSRKEFQLDRVSPVAQTESQD